MAWSLATTQGIRDRFRTVSPNQIPGDDIAEQALNDAEGLVRPMMLRFGDTIAASSATTTALVTRLAAVLCYVYANGPGANSLRDDEMRFIRDFLEPLASLPEGTQVTGVTNADETDPVFDYGEPESWTNSPRSDGEQRLF